MESFYGNNGELCHLEAREGHQTYLNATLDVWADTQRFYQVVTAPRRCGLWQATPKVPAFR